MALTTFHKQWSAIFNKACITFSGDINTRMKTDRPGATLLKSNLSDAQNPGNFSVGLAELDKIDLAAGNAKDLAAFPGNLKLFKAAVGKLTPEKMKYVKVLDEALNTKLSIKDKNGYVLPTPLKTAFPESYRQLKLLRAEVEAIHARAANALNFSENIGKTNQIAKETDKKKSKLEGDSLETQNKAAAIQEEAGMKKFLLSFSTSFKSGMAKGAAVIQRIKASPTLAVYNKEMNDGGRDISQNLNNIEKLQSNPKFAKSSLAKKLPKPGSLAAEITPFANGARRSLPNTATPDDVKQALADFTSLYKRIATTYADALAGKF